MTPEEKARELMLKYYALIPMNTISFAKQCALIAVNELLNNFLSNKTTKYGRERYHFWQNVKHEIEKL
jgi:hypothetical protein